MKQSTELPEPYGRMWPGVEVAGSPGRSAYVRSGEVMVPEDRAGEAMERLEGARWDRERPCPRTHARLVLEGGDRDVLRATERLREAGVPAAPNHVLVGIGAVTYAGAPRVQGGPGARVRPAGPVPDAPELGRGDGDGDGDGDGVGIAVLDTGLRSDNPWLAAHLPIDPSSDDWEEVDVEGDRILDAEAGHGTFIAGLVLQIAPGARVSVVRVLDSHGLGDDATVAAGLERLGEDVGIVNLSLGGYTVDDAPPPVLAAQYRGAPRSRGDRRRGRRQRRPRAARSGPLRCDPSWQAHASTRRGAARTTRTTAPGSTSGRAVRTSIRRSWTSGRRSGRRAGPPPSRAGRSGTGPRSPRPSSRRPSGCSRRDRGARPPRPCERCVASAGRPSRTGASLRRSSISSDSPS